MKSVCFICFDSEPVNDYLNRLFLNIESKEFTIQTESFVHVTHAVNCLARFLLQLLQQSRGKKERWMKVQAVPAVPAAPFTQSTHVCG